MSVVFDNITISLKYYLDNGYSKDDILIFVSEEIENTLESDTDFAEAERAVLDFHVQQQWVIEF